MADTLTHQANVVSSDSIPDPAWKMLLQRIALKKCTPFLGPEITFDSVFSSSKIALEWAMQNNYPMSDGSNLPRVAQYLSYRDDLLGSNSLKDSLSLQFMTAAPPDFKDRDEPHRILADLPIPIYINTHFMSFALDALKANPTKNPVHAICRWDRPDEPSGLDPIYQPSPANPLVYHLFGHINEPESLVLTEDDYLDFLVRTSADPELIPQSVQSAMVNHSLLFLGYQMNDLDFRVLLRSVNSLWQKKRSKNTHFSVQMVHVGSTPEQIELVKNHCKSYFSHGTFAQIYGYWGSTREFLSELRQRWEAYSVNLPPRNGS